MRRDREHLIERAIQAGDDVLSFIDVLTSNRPGETLWCATSSMPSIDIAVADHLGPWSKYNGLTLEPGERGEKKEDLGPKRLGATL